MNGSLSFKRKRRPNSHDNILSILSKNLRGLRGLQRIRYPQLRPRVLVPPRSGLNVQEDQIGAARIRETEVSEPVSVEVGGGQAVLAE